MWPGVRGSVIWFPIFLVSSAIMKQASACLFALRKRRRARTWSGVTGLRDDKLLGRVIIRKIIYVIGASLLITV